MAKAHVEQPIDDEQEADADIIIELSTPIPVYAEMVKTLKMRKPSPPTRKT